MGLEARDRYEEQRPGLGEAFAMQVDIVLARIVQAPLAYPRVHGETRRARAALPVRDLLPRDVR